jgi:hypothetical protein
MLCDFIQCFRSRKLLFKLNHGNIAERQSDRLYNTLNIKPEEAFDNFANTLIAKYGVITKTFTFTIQQRYTHILIKVYQHTPLWHALAADSRASAPWQGRANPSGRGSLFFYAHVCNLLAPNKWLNSQAEQVRTIALRRVGGISCGPHTPVFVGQNKGRAFFGICCFFPPCFLVVRVFVVRFFVRDKSHKSACYAA